MAVCRCDRAIELADRTCLKCGRDLPEQPVEQLPLLDPLERLRLALATSPLRGKVRP
jgi:hypothetical protein